MIFILGWNIPLSHIYKIKSKTNSRPLRTFLSHSYFCFFTKEVNGYLIIVLFVSNHYGAANHGCRHPVILVFKIKRLFVKCCFLFFKVFVSPNFIINVPLLYILVFVLWQLYIFMCPVLFGSGLWFDLSNQSHSDVSLCPDLGPIRAGTCLTAWVLIPALQSARKCLIQSRLCPPWWSWNKNEWQHAWSMWYSHGDRGICTTPMAILLCLDFSYTHLKVPHYGFSISWLIYQSM